MTPIFKHKDGEQEERRNLLPQLTPSLTAKLQMTVPSGMMASLGTTTMPSTMP